MKCPNCGYDEANTVSHKLLTHAMNRYVDPKTGKIDGTYNSDEDSIVVNGRQLIREDMFVTYTDARTKEQAELTKTAPQLVNNPKAPGVPGVLAPGKAVVSEVETLPGPEKVDPSKIPASPVPQKPLAPVGSEEAAGPKQTSHQSIGRPGVAGNAGIQHPPTPTAHVANPNVSKQA